MSKIPEIFESLEYGPAPESSERAVEWLDAHGRAFGHFIGGSFTAPGTAESFETLDPATAEPLARVLQGTEADVDAAVAAARAAQPGWWSAGPPTRARHLYALARRIQRNARLFAVLETLDNGKPIRESRDLDVPLAARHFYHHAGWAQLMQEELPGYEPVGVVGQIVPSSFPLLMLAWKIAPALAMGNAVVLKPAEDTPLTALLFAELCSDVGLPPGVVNVLTGDGRTGAALVAHPDVDKIAFTGSTEVGRLIREATAGSGKRLSLELGGKSPFLVFDDADLDSVVEGVVDAIWLNQGQVYRAGSRILVQEGVDATLQRKLRARMETLRMGDPMDETVDMGAIAPVAIFDPAVHMMTFRTPAEAVELANDTRCGLAASVWSENINLALDVAPKIKAGTVWINCTNVFDAASGFGGYRESGYGREGGEEGLWEYVRPSWEGAHEPAPVPASSRAVAGADGGVLGQVGRGNRKDVRNAVEAARKAQEGWAGRTAHNRAQILFHLAENLEARADELAHGLASFSGDLDDAAAEVAASVSRLFAYAGWADKWDGRVHATPFRNVTLAMREPIGVMGAVCPDERPLLGLVSVLAPLVALGNTVVAVPSESAPLPATDFYRVLDTSDVPGGVVNLVTGLRAELVPTLAAHDDVDGIWHFGSADGARLVEAASVGNLKRTWVDYGRVRDWMDARQGQGHEFLREATQIKNIWVPYGE